MTPRIPVGPLALAGFVAVSVAASGCIRLPGGGDGCPDVMCLMYCENGFETGADGCAVCACKDAPDQDAGPVACDAVACTLWCPAGFATDPATGCPTCSCNPVTSCFSDSDCATGQRCDVENHCLPPPGCDPGEDCPAVCAGMCVPATEPEPLCYSDQDCADGERCTAGNEHCLSPCDDPTQPCDAVCAGYCVKRDAGDECKDDSDCPPNQFCAIPDCARPGPDCVDAAGEPCEPQCAPAVCVDRQPSCEGAWIDQNGLCRTPWDGVYPPECCGLPTCGDGSDLLCERMPPACPRGTVPEVVNSCYGRCVDPRTCEPVAATVNCDPADVFCDMIPPTCPRGLVPSVSGGCWGECVRPEQCGEVAPPLDCNDGSTLQCRMRIPDCLPPFQVAIVDGCYQCLEPTQCQQPCSTDADCDRGEACVIETFDPCGPNADCDAPSYRYQVCRPATQECTGLLTCRLYCEYGYAVDPATGCELCQCNPAPDCVCTEEYAPVCGTDGNTYSNECFAACANVRVVHPGECRADCNIQCLRYDPVCGTNGVTYGCGAVEAECNGVDVAYPGECRETCVCTTEYRPVCGTNGRTYGNACEARCANVAVAYEGECRAECVCTREYAPVCGTDGVTYGNACLARCANATVASQGECRPAPGTCTDNAQCSWGEKCFRPTADDPTISVTGRCVAADYCESAADCSGLAPTIACVGTWSCRSNTCAYACSR